jgi:predicted RNA binding protein YcfA (HicA-like mRNA interferase family)
MASEARFADIRRLLERHGWTHRQGKGSHHVFKRPGGPTLVIPVHGNKVKPCYVRLADEAVRAIGKES